MLPQKFSAATTMIFLPGPPAPVGVTAVGAVEQPAATAATAAAATGIRRRFRRVGVIGGALSGHVA